MTDWVAIGGLALGLVNSIFLIRRYFTDKNAVRQEFEETVERMKTLEKNYDLFKIQKQEDMNRAYGVYERACGARKAKLAAQHVDVTNNHPYKDGPHLLEKLKIDDECNRALRDEKHRYEREREELQVKIRGLERRF